MSYEVERAPHPERAEHIFLSVVTKEYIQRFVHTDTDPDSLGEELGDVLQAASKAWREYVASGQRATVSSVQAELAGCQTAAELGRVGDKIKGLAMTAVEREAMQAVYMNQLQTIRNGQVPQ